MSGTSTNAGKLDVNARIPAGYRAVPIDRPTLGAVCRLCLLVSTAEEYRTNPFIILRTAVDAQYYLGCLTDNAGRWLEWVEIAVQQTDGLQNTPASYCDMLNNHVLDGKWIQRSSLLRELQPDDVIVTGYETENLPPLFYDPAKNRFITAADDESGELWQLCRDDHLLEECELPPYHASLARYLYNPRLGVEAGLVPLTRESPTNESTVEFTDILPQQDKSPIFNHNCGLLETKKFYPLSLEEYVDLLSGRPWRGVRHAGQPVNLEETCPCLGEMLSEEMLDNQFLMQPGTPTGRLCEVFCLKLQVFVQLMRLVRQLIRRTQMPMLNLNAESFRVKFEGRNGALPMYWTARCALAVPGQTLALRARNAGQRFFMRLGGAPYSIYQPGKIHQIQTGEAEVRLRNVSVQDGEAVLKGTLCLKHPCKASGNDILWIKIPLSAGPIGFLGNIEPEDALSQLDMPFKTWPTELDDEDIEELKTTAEGFALPPIPYEIIPMISTPVDSYSLAALAVRTFLTNDQRAHQEAFDDMLSLAREMALRFDTAIPLKDRLEKMILSQDQWLKRFGPHLVLNKSPQPNEALQAIGVDSWFELLSVIITMLPGIGPDSLCPDYHFTSPSGLESCFETPISRLERLLATARATFFQAHAPRPAAP